MGVGPQPQVGPKTLGGTDRGIANTGERREECYWGQVPRGEEEIKVGLRHGLGRRQTRLPWAGESETKGSPATVLGKRGRTGASTARLAISETPGALGRPTFPAPSQIPPRLLPTSQLGA